MRHTSIHRLPAVIRERIGALRREGHTIDEILTALGQVGVRVSRSALGRHTQRIDAVAATIEESRAVAEALVARFGEAGDDGRAARLNIELLHGLAMRLLSAEGGVDLDAREVASLSSAVRSLTLAAKSDTERERTLRREIAERALETVAAAGVSADVEAAVRRALAA